MSNMSDQTKQEPMTHGGPSNGTPAGTVHSNPIADGSVAPSNGGSSSSSRSKPQACKVCGKMLSSASSYYVHMKLHSGTKPYRCGVSKVVVGCERGMHSNKPCLPTNSGLRGCLLSKAVLGSAHEDTHRGTTIPVQPLLETVLPEVFIKHPQAHSHRYDSTVHLAR